MIRVSFVVVVVAVVLLLVIVASVVIAVEFVAFAVVHVAVIDDIFFNFNDVIKHFDSNAVNISSLCFCHRLGLKVHSNLVI